MTQRGRHQCSAELVSVKMTPRRTCLRRVDWRRLGKRRGPPQQPVVRKTNFDRRQWQVVAGGHDDKQAALIMRRDRYTAGEAVSSQCVGELPGSRIVRSIQMDVDVANDEDRVVERRDPVEHIRQLSEEG